MKDGLTNFNKVCETCKKAKHISKFKGKSRNYKICLDCRKDIYHKCQKCGVIKKFSRIMDGVPFNNICEKCRTYCVNKQNEILTEALDKIERLYIG